MAAPVSAITPERARLQIDSLLKVLPSMKADTQIVETHRVIAHSYSLTGELPKMREHIETALRICERYVSVEQSPENTRRWTFITIDVVRNFIGYVHQSGQDQLEEAMYRKMLGYFEGTGNELGIAELKLCQAEHHAHHTGKFEIALGLCSESMVYWNRTGNKRKLITAAGYMGRYYKALDDQPAALKYYFQAMQGAEELGDTMTLSSVYHSVGNCYRGMKEYKTALDYLLKGLAMRTYLKKTDLMTSSYGSIGILYQEMGDNKLALDFHNKALELSEKDNNWTFQTMTLNNIAIIYMDRKRFAEAVEKLRLALEIRKKNNDLDGQSWYMNSMAGAFLAWEKPDSSLVWSFKALDLLKTVNNREYFARAYYHITRAYAMQKKHSLAVEYAGKGLAVADEIGSAQWAITLHLLLSEIYSDAGDHKRSLEQFKLYTAKKDSLFNDENTRKKVRTEMNFEFDKKQQALQLEQEKKDALAAEEKRRQRLVTWSVTGGLLLVLLFAGVLFNRFRVIRRQHAIIEEQKAMVEEKNKSITDSINYAQRIQRALLASGDLLTKNLEDHFVLFLPKDIVSGDFYWAVEKDGRFYLAVCDSTGHGVPGAFMSLLNISFMNEAISEKGIAQPGAVFSHVRNRLISNISADGAKDGMDGILVCLGKQELKYAAAHNAPVLIRQDRLEEMPADKMPVGKGESDTEFTTHTIALEKGDMVYLYTDGYADQFGGPKGKKFKYRQLEELLVSIHQKPMEEQRAILASTIAQWQGGLEQVDDILIIGIRV